MNQLLLTILILFIIILSSYLIGKFFAKGILKEIDTFLGNKFIDHINNKSKKEEDGNKEKTE